MELLHISLGVTKRTWGYTEIDLDLLFELFADRMALMSEIGSSRNFLRSTLCGSFGNFMRVLGVGAWCEYSTTVDSVRI
jgi:hypothetical protein